MKAFGLSLLTVVASAAAVGLVPAALAHGVDMNMDAGEADKPRPEDQYPPTYFALADHRVAIYAHIGLMVLAWVFMLPTAVMFSLARSRYTLAAQFAFAATNSGGLLLGTIYSASTPDLYPGNAHHNLGWIASCIVGVQTVIGLLARIAGFLSRKASHQGLSHERQSFIPVSTEAMAEHEIRHGASRFSNDSGQGTECNTDSLRSPSVSSNAETPPIPLRDVRKSYEDEGGEGEETLESHLPVFPRSGMVHSVARKAAAMVSSRFWKFFVFTYNLVDRTVLVLGFVALCTGIATYGRFFEGHGIFSGLAHWVKGGVFFWLGIFTLGRWAGSFGELGWAWNVRPKSAGMKWRPSAEFVESALIFFYGSTNIFLEHLGSWGAEWSSQDLEHLSITVLFIGGGLLGMLVESVKIRDLLNMNVAESSQTVTLVEGSHTDEERDQLSEPDTYPFSINPIPALVILLLGIMMSSHTQESMISTMVHKQWGQLLTGSSFARGLTYVLVYLKPPKSIYPSRPPTEILAAFGLMSGGIIFMASASDTVEGMIHYQLDAMFMYTVTMGLVGLLMAWIVLVVALKGWAFRKEAARPTNLYRSAA